MSFALLQISSAQQPPSIPISEVTIKAGEAFSFYAQLQTPLKQSLRAATTYYLNEKNPNGPNFYCYGDAPPNELRIKLQCGTSIKLTGGEYRSNGELTLVRLATSDQQVQKVRFPIVTVVENPEGTTEFPVVVGTSLSLTTRQSLTDGAVRTQVILSSLSAHFPIHAENSPANRAYLREEVERARTVVDLTRRRYEEGQGKGAPLPFFFEDFDRRLSKIIRDLGGTPSRTSSKLQTSRPHLVLAQLPKTTDSTTAIVEPGVLDKPVKSSLRS